MISETPNYDKLRWRLKRFVDAYIETGVGVESMRRIGFTGKRPDQAASKLKAKPNVAAALAEKRRQAERIAGGSAAEVLSILWDTLQRCRQVQPVVDRYGKPVFVETPDGKLAPAYAFDPKNALKAAELLGKHHGLFADLVKTQQLDKYGKPMTPSTGPTYIIEREEVKLISRDLDDKI